MPLTEEQKKQLDTNIRSMLENGASQTDVESYAKDFKAKYETVEKKSEVGVVAGSESQSSGSVTDLYKQGTTETAVTELAAKTNENVSQTASYKEGDKYTLNGNIYTYKSNDTWVRRENNEQGGQDGFQIENKDFGQFISGGEAQPLKTFKYSGIDYRYNPTDGKWYDKAGRIASEGITERINELSKTKTVEQPKEVVAEKIEETVEPVRQNKEALLYEKKYGDMPELVQQKNIEIAEKTQWKPTLTEEENLQLAQAKNEKAALENRLAEYNKSDDAAVVSAISGKESGMAALLQEEIRAAEEKAYNLDITAKSRDKDNYNIFYNPDNLKPIAVPNTRKDTEELLSKFYDENFQWREDYVTKQMSTEFQGKKYSELSSDQKAVVKAAFAEKYKTAEQLQKMIGEQGLDYDLSRFPNLVNNAVKSAIQTTGSIIEGADPSKMQVPDVLNTLIVKASNRMITKSEYERALQNQKSAIEGNIKAGYYNTGDKLPGLEPIGEGYDPQSGLKRYTYSAEQINSYLGKMPSYEDANPKMSPYLYEKGQLGDVAEKVSDYANTIKTNPIYKEEFATKVAGGLGSTIPFIAATLASRGMNLPSALVTAMTGGLANASGSYNQAIEGGATPEQAKKAYWAGLGIGATEAIPLEKLMDRFGVGQSFLDKTIEVGKQGVTEMWQEQFSSLSNDALANLLYDESVKIGETANSDGSIGFATGILTGGSGALLSRPDVTPKQKELAEKATANIRKYVIERGEVAKEQAKINVEKPVVETKVEPEVVAEKEKVVAPGSGTGGKEPTLEEQMQMELDANPDKRDEILAKYEKKDVKNVEVDKKSDIERRRQEDFNNENESYRVIVGDEAFNDIVESGVVRTNAETKSKKEGGIDLSNRPTAYPSFSKGKASMDYAAENPNNYIIVTEDSSIQPSKVGRHGKGTTMFPTDENGNHLKELSGEKIKVYKHIGNGEYILVYANGKEINAKYDAELEELDTKEEVVPSEPVLEEKLQKGSKLQWDRYGNESTESWTVGEKVKTRGGQDAVELTKVYVESSQDGKTYSKEYADANGIKYDNEYLTTQIVTLSDLEAKTEAEKVSEPDTKQAELDAKIEEGKKRLAEAKAKLTAKDEVKVEEKIVEEIAVEPVKEEKKDETNTETPSLSEIKSDVIERNGTKSYIVEKPNVIKGDDTSKVWYKYEGDNGEELYHSELGFDYNMKGEKLPKGSADKLLTDNKKIFEDRNKINEAPKPLLNAILNDEKGWLSRMNESSTLQELEEIEKELQTNGELKKQLLGKEGKDFYSRLNYLRRKEGGESEQNPISERLSKYGWTVEPQGKDQVVRNANGKIVATVKTKGAKYEIIGNDGAKLMSGNKNVAEAVEKVATKYFMAQEKVAKVKDEVVPVKEVKAEEPKLQNIKPPFKYKAKWKFEGKDDKGYYHFTNTKTGKTHKTKTGAALNNKFQHLPKLPEAFEASDARSAALQYFVEGGTVRTEDIEIARKRGSGKLQKEELTSYLWALDNTSLPLDIIAEGIAERNGLDSREVEKEMRDLLSMGKQQIGEEIKDLHKKGDNAGMPSWMVRENEEMEAALEQEAKALTDFADAYSELTEEEIAEIYAEAAQAESDMEDAEIEQYLETNKTKEDETIKKSTGENGDNAPISKEETSGKGGEETDIDKRIAEKKAKLSKLKKDRNNLGIGENLGEKNAEMLAAYTDLAILYAQKGIKTAIEFAKELGEDINEFIQEAWDKANSEPVEEIVEEPKPETKIPEVTEEEEPEEKEKALLNRAFKGATEEELQAAIEKHGLTYEVESWEAAKKKARALIDDIGIEAAVQAVKDRVVVGAPAAFVWGEAIDAVHNAIAVAETQAELDRLTKIEADLMSEFDKQERDAGRFISALRDVYANSDFNYDLETQIQKYKDNNGGVIPKEVEDKMRELSEQLKDIQAKYDEAKKRNDELEYAENVRNIQDSVNREKGTPMSQAEIDAAIEKGVESELNKAMARLSDARKKTAKKAIEALEKLDKSLTGMNFDATIGIPVAIVRGGIKTAIAGIKLTGKIADAIESGMKHIQEEYEKQFGKKLPATEYNRVKTFIKDNLKDAGLEVSNRKDKPIKEKDGKIVIPPALIRELVESGLTDPNELTQAVLQEVQKSLPEATERQVRDAISNYGRTVNQSQEDIDIEIRKIKRAQRIISALEDIANKKRPLRSGLQRDKLDAEERALQKQLKEALKTLPPDTALEAKQLKTTLDVIEKRLLNQIEDLQREIDAEERTVKERKEIPYTDRIKDLIAERDAKKAEHEEIFGKPELTAEQRLEIAIKSINRAAAKVEERIRKGELTTTPNVSLTSAEKEAAKKRLADARAQLMEMQELAGIPEQKRLEQAKNNAKRRIAELQNKIDIGDFAKKKKKKIIKDDELKTLLAEKNRIKEKFNKLQYEAELRNRSKPQKVIDALLEVWGITRALRATAEFSFMLIQGGFYAVSHPLTAMKALSVAFSHLTSTSRSERFAEQIKTQDWYEGAREDKLAITEVDYKLSAREELFLNGWVNHIWDAIGLPLKLVSEKAFQRWKLASFPKAFERSNVGAMNLIRITRYLKGVEMLEAQGKTRETHPQDYKNVADMVNTFTGRASLGGLENNKATSKLLTTIFFSPKMWASTLKTFTPYAFMHFGKMSSAEFENTGNFGKDKKVGKRQVSVAQKMAMADYMKYVGLTTAAVMAIALRYNNDDDEDTSVELDPRSSDFLKIKIGNTRVDPWGGRIQMIVLQARLLAESMNRMTREEGWAAKLGWRDIPSYKRTSSGELVRLGEGYTDTMGGVLTTMTKNKLAPSAALVNKWLFAKLDKEGNTVDKFGNPYEPSDELINNLYPIYIETIKELYQDQPYTVATFLTFYAFLGGGAQTYEPPKPKASSPVKPIAPIKPAKPVKPL